MPGTFRKGDRVSWNSEAGRVRGVIVGKVTSDFRFKGYVHHASPAVPQYLIQSEKTDHVAIHKGRALRRLKPHRPKRRKKARNIAKRRRR